RRGSVLHPARCRARHLRPCRADASAGANMRTITAAGVVGRIYLGLVLFFLYTPILLMALLSFNLSGFYPRPFRFTLDWYVKLSGNEMILRAAWRSVWIALATVVIATTIGTAAAIALHRYDFPGKRLLQALLFPPIAIPWLITGTAMLVFFFWIGVG